MIYQTEYHKVELLFYVRQIKRMQESEQTT